MKMEPIPIAKILLYRKKENQIEYLLVEECDGLFGLPGGGGEVFDKTIIDTAKRELKEELHIKETDYILMNTNYTLEFIYHDPQSVRHNKQVVMHIFLAEYLSAKPIKATSEIKAVHWKNKVHLIDKVKHHPDIVEAIEFLTNSFDES